MRQSFSIVVLLVFSFVFSLAFTYLVSGPLQHKRYWDVTDRLVKENQALYHSFVLETLAKKLHKNNLLKVDDIIVSLSNIPKHHMAIDVYENENLVLQHQQQGRKLSVVDFKVVSIGTMAVHYHIYQPPDWDERFFKWLHPKSWPEWLSNKWNFITYPFVSVAILLFLCAFIVLLRKQVKFLDAEIVDKLDNIEKKYNSILGK